MEMNKNKLLLLNLEAVVSQSGSSLMDCIVLHPFLYYYQYHYKIIGTGAKKGTTARASIIGISEWSVLLKNNCAENRRLSAQS